MGLFDKKYCDLCGDKIGLLGNRKLENGNMCKECAGKLSEWFSDRRSSTVEEIKQQLAWREENKGRLEAFHVTRTIPSNVKIYLDEDAKQFIVTRYSRYREENADVLDYADVTGCQFDIDDEQIEITYTNSEGEEKSYNPPRYKAEYDFYITLYINNPYFDEIRIQINNCAVEGKMSPEYKKYDEMGKEIKVIFEGVREGTRQEVREAAAPKAAVNCPYCGATTMPTPSGCCEYCGGALQG